MARGKGSGRITSYRFSAGAGMSVAGAPNAPATLRDETGGDRPRPRNQRNAGTNSRSTIVTGRISQSDSHGNRPSRHQGLRERVYKLSESYAPE